MSDLMIDLGPSWGHVVPLSLLENIRHIETLEEGKLKISAKPADVKQVTTLVSRKPFDDEQLEFEKNRLLGLSNGLISKADAQGLLTTMEASFGVKPKEILTQPLYDIGFIRKVLASQNNEAYYRFVLHFDPETQQILMDDDYNQEFVDIIPSWLDPSTIAEMSLNEQMLVFAYEALYRAAEPFLPEPEESALMDPDANIPAMGVRGGAGVAQTVDIAKAGSDNIVATLG